MTVPFAYAIKTPFMIDLRRCASVGSTRSVRQLQNGDWCGSQDSFAGTAGMPILNGSAIGIHTIRIGPLLFLALGRHTCKPDFDFQVLSALIPELKPPLRIRRAGAFPSVTDRHFGMIRKFLPVLPVGWFRKQRRNRNKYQKDGNLGPHRSIFLQMR